MKKFSKKYEGVDIWLDRYTQDTPYKRRILHLMALYPWATLSQLRGHPGKGEKPLCSMHPGKLTPEVRADLDAKVKRYALGSGCFAYDSNGMVMPWRRPRDEPE